MHSLDQARPRCAADEADVEDKGHPSVVEDVVCDGDAAVDSLLCVLGQGECGEEGHGLESY